LNILGAYCPDDHEYVDRRYTDKNLNAQSLIELFTLLMARHPQTTYFRIYLDNARYHHAVLLREWLEQVQQERGVVFALKHLPAYSPNLNLIERLWKFLRKEALQKWHATFEDMQQAVAEVLDHLERACGKPLGGQDGLGGDRLTTRLGLCAATGFSMLLARSEKLVAPLYNKAIPRQALRLEFPSPEYKSMNVP
jgi:transposase